MILYGIEIYAEKTEWTTNFIEAKKVVESAIRPIEDCGEDLGGRNIEKW
ncbi:TPA: hypothetical protein ACSY2G_10415 [Listeria monocytogenes]|nr:hypothetical protein [Listeria seeligeri]EHR3723566.1 hypothetical protein [Listeria monocytogenes]EIS7815134.1 hypothetical protein [Listeria monocytogenes]MBF2624883.1 hypothetical protein [Listeria seeligeri]